MQQKINDLFMRLPNLLDSRVVDGSGEAENELVLEWGNEYIKVYCYCNTHTYMNKYIYIYMYIHVHISILLYTYAAKFTVRM